MDATFNTGDALDAMKAMAKEPASPQRAKQAWLTLLRVLGNTDSGVVTDFATEHGLIHSPGDRTPSQPGYSWINPIDRSEMIWIPPGRYYIGSEKQPAECAGFSLARHPVTNEQFARFLSGGRAYRSRIGVHDRLEHHRWLGLAQADVDRPSFFGDGVRRKLGGFCLSVYSGVCLVVGYHGLSQSHPCHVASYLDPKIA